MRLDLGRLLDRPVGLDPTARRHQLDLGSGLSQLDPLLVADEAALDRDSLARRRSSPAPARSRPGRRSWPRSEPPAPAPPPAGGSASRPGPRPRRPRRRTGPSCRPPGLRRPRARNRSDSACARAERRSRRRSPAAANRARSRARRAGRAALSASAQRLRSPAAGGAEKSAGCGRRRTTEVTLAMLPVRHGRRRPYLMYPYFFSLAICSALVWAKARPAGAVVLGQEVVVPVGGVGADRGRQRSRSGRADRSRGQPGDDGTCCTGRRSAGRRSAPAACVPPTGIQNV